MGIYRSEIMRLYQLNVPKDDAWNVMNEFGDVGKAHFIDLNKEESPYNLPYTQKIKACEETERKLDYLLDQCKRNVIPVNPPENIDGFLHQLRRIKENKKKAINLLLEEIQKDVRQQESFIQEQNTRMKDAEASLNSLKDCLQVLNVAQLMLPQIRSQFDQQMGQDMESGRSQENMGLIGQMDGGKTINIQNIAGVIEQHEIERLRRLIFRSTKGKSFLFVEQFANFGDEQAQTPQKKRSVYIIVFWDGNHIREKIQKICDSFSGQRIELPNLNQIDQKIIQIQGSVGDATNVFNKTKQSLREQLLQFDQIAGNGQDGGPAGSSSTIYIYKMFLAKEKALYLTLNLMKWQNQGFVGYYWAPVELENDIKRSIDKYSAAKISAYDNHSIPRPTYFKTTEFLAPFQALVDMYGIPTYLEANPAPIAIASFPFLFGMMFGDMGHGSLYLIFGTILILMNDKLKNGPLAPFCKARYLLFLMGFFSTYCGMLYNEWFALPTQMFQSCYMEEVDGVNQAIRTQTTTTVLTGDTTKVQFGDDQFYYANKTVLNQFEYQKVQGKDCNYAFGLDPIWGITSNKLGFQNGVKMKISVIMGIFHMTIGILMKGTNAVYHGHWIDLITEVIFGLVIFYALFGWMDMMIISKWFIDIDIEDRGQDKFSAWNNMDWGESYNDVKDNTANFTANSIFYTNGDLQNQAIPSIIQIMITTDFMGDSFTPNPYLDGVEQMVPVILSSNKSQYAVATALLIVAVLLIPGMLLAKPIIAAFFTKHDDADRREIEFTNINRGDGLSEPMMGGANYQALNSNEEDNSRKVTTDMINMRQNQMKDLDKQLRDMGVNEGAHSFGDVFVHSMIETIEFVLGTVSNTASYLRLWALSLAHGVLAEVFMQLVYQQTPIQPYSTGNVPKTVIFGIIAWPCLWCATFFILMCMDCLECTLHTVRLHWVEFQNKFFKGEGYGFRPYSYESVLKEVLETE